MRNIKYATEEVREFLKEYNYVLLDQEYINCKTKMITKCPKGHIHEVSFDNFKRGKRCPTCNNNSKKLTYDEVKKYVESFNYKLIDENYINANRKLNMKCPNHKHNIFKMNFAQFKLGHRCPKCQHESRSLSYEEIENRITSENGYELIGVRYDYKLKQKITYITYKCLNNHIHETTMTSFRNGSRCPFCSETKGEKSVRLTLNKYLLQYEQYKKFDDCFDVRALEFDFFIPSKNVIIEYDGRQHYESIDCFGGEKYLKNIKRKDEIKNQYCINNNIKLIRIPYWKFDNIEEIIKNEIINEKPSTTKSL